MGGWRDAACSDDFPQAVFRVFWHVATGGWMGKCVVLVGPFEHAFDDRPEPLLGCAGEQQPVLAQALVLAEGGKRPEDRFTS